MNKNFKYKVGERVIVREDLHKGHFYNMENSKEHNCIAEDMLPLRGDIVTIDRIADYGQYKIREDNGVYNWTDEMFSGLANDDWKVVITPNGDETTATLYRGKTVEKKATVKRYSKDTYSIEMACEAVIEKLNAHLENGMKIIKRDSYKVGDRVKIVDHWNIRTCENKFGMMDKWLGKIMTISGQVLGSYRMKEDYAENGGDGWSWNVYCIEGKVVNEDENEGDAPFKAGDLVEITDKDDAHYKQRGVIFYIDDDGIEAAVDFKVPYFDTHNCKWGDSPALPENTGRFYNTSVITKVE